jgi:aryl-alcohol dehydrogenase-like predicted oxidoreductase
MDTFRLGAGNVTVSPLGIGTWSWGDNLYWGYGKGYGESDLRQAFGESLQAGVTLFDTAEIYGFGKSESFIGKFRRDSPLGSNARIATKFFPLPWRLTRGQVLSALRGSLRRLGVSTVDLYQIHWPSPLFSIDTMMDALAEAVEKNMTRAVGVSNFNAEQVRRAHKRLASRGIPLASNQVEYNLLQRAPDFNGLVETCRELNVSIIAYSPLKFGILTGKYSPSNPLPGARGGQFNAAYLTSVQPMLVELKRLSEQYQKSMSQIAINWVMQRGALPIPGAKNARQARENAGALGWSLSPEGVDVLDKIGVSILRAR